mgnify:CR=1 FL=1
MKKYSIFALALVMGAMTLTSCEDAFGNFLDKQPSNELTKAEVLGNFTLLEENHNDTYNFLLHGANRVNNSWMDAATDLAESSIGTSGTRTTFNIGNYYGGGGAAELTSPWESRYRGIRKCNITINTLEQDTENKLRPADIDVELYNSRKANYIAEARFLRAYFYWELFLRYGPVPLVTTELDPNGDLMTGYTERPDLKTFMDYLFKEVKECESSLKTYAETSDATYAGEVNQPTARALYVRMMLYMASPRYSAQSGVTWQQAADAAAGFIADYGENYRLEDRTNGGVAAYNNAWLLNTYTDKNPEVIFFRNDVAIGWSVRRLLPSLSFQSRICNLPSTTAMRPLVKYWQTNSAVWRQATTSMKSVAFSPLSRLLKSRSTATEKDVTAVPFCVRRSSGSRVSRPMMTIRFNIALPSLFALADDHGADDTIGNAEDTVQFLGEIGRAREGDQNIVAFGDVVDGVGQLALAPLLNLHSRAVLLHEGLELFGQSGDLLFGQSAVHDENDLIVCGNLSHSWLHLLLD